MLGRSGASPPAGELEFLQSLLDRPTRYPGTIPPADYLFLTAFVSILAPRRVIEIGTLTGFSAAIIAAALRRRHPEDNASWVDTIDVKAICPVDEARPTGFEVAESFPELASAVRVHVPHDSSIVRELAQRDELELVFIDNGHSHPQPLLDLLRLAPFVRSGGWMVLHDIELGTCGRNAAEAGQAFPHGTPYGAEWLFSYWPFRKISGGNIGAVQLPHDKSALVPFALRLMSMPFEISEGGARAMRRSLYQTFAELL